MANRGEGWEGWARRKRSQATETVGEDESSAPEVPMIPHRRMFLCREGPLRIEFPATGKNVGDATKHVWHRWHAAMFLVAWALLALNSPPAAAQQDSSSQPRTAILEFPNLGPVPGSMEPSLGPGPGALAPSMNIPGATGGAAGTGALGGKRRTGRIPRGGKPLPGASSIAAARGMQTPESLPTPMPPTALPIPVTTIDTAVLDDPGPPDGLTFDEAIERMMADNLDLRALRHELTQADADILTAGLRTNPLVYMDTQFIPYGSFNEQRPGGPTQYDVNITYPIDVSGKRQSRVVVARMARTALEAQFQDVSRRQIDTLGRAFVTLQAARIDRLSARATVRRQEGFLAEYRASSKPDDPVANDAIDHLAFVLERARAALGEAEEAYQDAQEGLAVLLNLPPGETMRLEPRGTLRDTVPPPPPTEELMAIALRCRPDVLAARLGVNRANAEVGLQRANRLDDVYLFYDPITIQDSSPYNRQTATSWAIGLTCALPIFNRNQGNIARAQSNVSQSKLELSSLERRAVAEVRLAEREYLRSSEALGQIEKEVLPRAHSLIRRKTEQFAAGTINADDFQDNLDTVAETTQSHRDALVRHRRAMLDLNTAVGLRILP
ncbi:MAG: TolC family protein [Planctomycetia bacterium]